MEPFGTTPDGTAVQRWTLANGDMTVRVLTYGGIVQSLEVPDAHGKVDNVVLGFPDLAGYVEHNNPGPYFGALIGRYGNRIAGGTFALDGQTYHLPRSTTASTPCTAGRRASTPRSGRPPGRRPTTRVGAAAAAGQPRRRPGLPGTLTTTVTYTLDRRRAGWRMDYEATTDAPDRASTSPTTPTGTWRARGAARSTTTSCRSTPTGTRRSTRR